MKFIIEKKENGETEKTEAIIRLDQQDFNIAKELLEADSLAYYPKAFVIGSNSCVKFKGYLGWYYDEKAFFEEAINLKAELLAAINEVKHFQKIQKIVENLKEEES